ncbi:unnamed protein product [Rotaria magnacalcarata]
MKDQEELLAMILKVNQWMERIVLDSEEKKNSGTIQREALVKILQLLIHNIKDAQEENSEEAHNITCDACGSSPVRGDRYKCLQCEDFDICASCFERRAEPKQHKSGHLLIHLRLPEELFGRTVSNDDLTIEHLKQFYAKEVHESVTCDGCTQTDFVGLRFKCDTCPDYDLCYRCASKSVLTSDHKLTHPLILSSHRVIAQIPVNDIELGEKLGSGAFGSVHKARWTSKNLQVACKVIIVPDSNEISELEKSFFKELAAYMELSGGYILKTYGYALARQRNKKVYMIIMEYMARGSLASVLKEKDKISLRRKVCMARQIASGMRKIHEHHMIHRDIRPDNILVNENYNCKIGDMGIARVVDPFNQHTQIGCPPFMPPEFRAGTYNQKLDIFTFGLTMNELFTETQHSFRMLAKEKIVFQKESPIFQDLIARCTADDPKYRPAAIEIEKTLELYSRTFDEIILKKNLGYILLPTEKKNTVFIKFYGKIHRAATEFIRTKFPSEFLEGSTSVQGVKATAIAMQTKDEYEAKHSRKLQDVDRALRHSKKDRRTKQQLLYQGIQDDDSDIGVHCKERSMNRQESSDEEDLNQNMLLNTASSKYGGKQRFTFVTGVIPKPTNTYKDNNNLTKFITSSELLHVTPHEMIQCNLAQPNVDMNMYSDLLRAFNYPSMESLKKIMKILETLPYNHHSETNQRFNAAMHNFQRQHSADSNQYRRLLEIRRTILERSSYELLLIYNGRFFVIRSTSKHRCSPIIKSHPIIKDNGQLESPRETAVREAYKAIEYWEVNTGEWQCTVEHEIERQKYYRLIGLFVIRLSTEIQFRALHSKELRVNGEWIPLDADIDQKEYYQLYPFIEYIRNHIGVLLD